MPAYFPFIEQDPLSLHKASNLSDLASVASAKANLSLVKGDVGLGNVDNTSDATKPVSTAQATADALRLLATNNLSDVPTPATARTNLGLGSAATQPSSAFDAAGLAAAEQARALAAEALLAPKASPALTGAPTAPTQTPLDNSTKLGTTAYADAAVAVETSRATAAEATKASSSALTAETSRATAAEATLIPLSQKGAANGVATLDSGGKLPAGQITALAVQTVWPVASQAAMLALSAAQVGDLALRSDVSENFILSALPPSTLANWTTLLVPAESELVARKDTAGGYAGLDSGGLLKLAEVPPLPESRVTGLTADLGLRQSRWNVRTLATVAGGSTWTLAAYDQIEVDATLGIATVQPPAAPSVGDEITLKKMDASSNVVTFQATLDGTVNPSLIYRYGTFRAVWDGTVWVRPDRHTATSLVDWPATPDARYDALGAAGVAEGNALAYAVALGGI